MTQFIASLLALPAEVVDTILSHLDATDLVNVSRVSHLLHQHGAKDSLWQSLVQENVPSLVDSYQPCQSWKDLYVSHHPHWFLARRKIWFADTDPCGKLIVARYDSRRGCIEAYALTASRSGQDFKMLDWSSGPPLQYHPFHPKVELDLNQAVLCLSREDGPNVARRGNKVQSETPMDVATGGTDRLSSAFLFTRPLPPHLTGLHTAVWPPPGLPSPNDHRVRNASDSGFRSTGHKPSRPSEASDAAFRIRTWVQFSHIFSAAFFGGGGMGGRAETVTTFASLPEEAYTPTKEKPWQGIWCGDYSAHGCEFLLVTQPDRAKPLPEKASRAFARWPKSNVGFWGGQPTVDIVEPEEGEETPLDSPEVAPTNLTAALSFLENHGDQSNSSDRSSRSSADSSDLYEPPDEAPYRGRLEAIKLTGDPNVPRGEISFVAEDLGSRGFVGYAKEPLFSPHGQYKDDDVSDDEGYDSSTEDPNYRGARMVKSCGHIAGTHFKGDNYIPSQLIIISENRLGMWWLRKLDILVPSTAISTVDADFTTSQLGAI